MKLKDNKIYRWIMIPLCIALCIFGVLFSNITKNYAIGVLSIFLGSLILWLTIGIDWPSVLCLFSLGLLSCTSFSSVLTSSFGNSTFIFLLFTFICTYALSKTSLIKRIAIAFVDSKLAKRSGKWFIFLFLFAVLLLGLVISPTVLFVVILPILNEIFEIAKINKEDKIAKILMMGLGFTVSISSGMTPIAHVFPVLAMNAAKISVDPLKYMAFAIPTGLVVFILMYFMFIIIIRPDASKFKNLDLSEIKNNLEKVNKRDIFILSIFIVVILLWIVPSFFKDGLPEVYNFINQYGTAMPPILGTILLCVIRIDSKPLIKIDDALKNGVPWGSLLMCAATLSLGSVLTSDAVGIKAFLQNNFGGAISSFPGIILLIIFITWAAIQTNLSSNMVTATLVATVAFSILSSAETGLNISVVICLIGMMASFAFATPPSMPHIAIIAGSDYCSTKDVLLFGSLLMIISIICACAIGYPLGSLII